MKESRVEMIDIRDPDHEVEVLIKDDVVAPGQSKVTIWVNVDGVCKLRVTGVDRHKLNLDVTAAIESG